MSQLNPLISKDKEHQRHERREKEKWISYQAMQLVEHGDAVPLRVPRIGQPGLVCVLFDLPARDGDRVRFEIRKPLVPLGCRVRRVARPIWTVLERNRSR